MCEFDSVKQIGWL